MDGIDGNHNTAVSPATVRFPHGGVEFQRSVISGGSVVATSESKNSIQVIERMTHLLDALAGPRSRHPEAACATSLHPSAAHRILTALVHWWSSGSTRERIGSASACSNSAMS
jgi:hypothetical protein